MLFFSKQRGGSGVRRGCGGGARGPPPRAGHRTLRDAERRSGAIPAIPGEAARIHSVRPALRLAPSLALLNNISLVGGLGFIIIIVIIILSVIFVVVAAAAAPVNLSPSAATSTRTVKGTERKCKAYIQLVPTHPKTGPTFPLGEHKAAAAITQLDFSKMTSFTVVFRGEWEGLVFLEHVTRTEHQEMQHQAMKHLLPGKVTLRHHPSLPTRSTPTKRYHLSDGTKGRQGSLH
ncbi:hypothetical protein DV515_00005614 [Chloebia gouldiae]|uniref:Uncharacterized protein n=1 Tax=Chloebia gouldiae TaxID=44316 RepID=A0A3L8SNH7_CHLGU|nr:hypothetical protein DV515_00005614 [Chloebia gouldiae]